MLSAVIHARKGHEAVVATLSALVPGVAEGILSDAVVVCDEPDNGIATIADAMGAEYVVLKPGENPWTVGARRARREWLICLEAGDVPVEGWIRAVDRFASLAGREGYPIGRLARGDLPLSRRLLAVFERLSARPRTGDVVHVSRLRGEPARRVAAIDAVIIRERAL